MHRPCFGATNHAYWNLAGHGDVAGHDLRVDADQYVPVDDALIPVGHLEDVAGTPFDLRSMRPLSDIVAVGGIDHCLVMRELGSTTTLRDRSSGRVLTLRSNQPGLQVYTGQYLARSVLGRLPRTRGATGHPQPARVRIVRAQARRAVPALGDVHLHAGRVNDAPHRTTAATIEQPADLATRRTMTATLVSRAPGRVNLIGEHTDYTGGLALPIAIDRWTEVVGIAAEDHVRLVSADADGVVDITLDDRDSVEGLPPWGRYVKSVLDLVQDPVGIEGRVTTTIPVGAGLSSSAALEIAVAIGIGFRGSPLELAELGQRAEHDATGVPTGIMDQLCIATRTAGSRNPDRLHRISLLNTSRFQKTSASSSAMSLTALSKAASTPLGLTSARWPSRRSVRFASLRRSMC